MGKKNPNAVALGRRGGRARQKKLPPAERSDLARRAARARWDKKDGKADAKGG